MLCRIAKPSDEVRPIAWRAGGTPAAAGAREKPGDILELQRRLADGERARQNELESVRQQAFQDGLRQGREQSAAEVKAASERLAVTLNDLVALKRRLRQQAESEVVKLSIAIARRILHRELIADPEALRGVVHAALQTLAVRDIARVRVAPASAELVRSALERSGAPAAIAVVPDAALKTGDLLFETSLGELDASIETQLGEIERGFADRLAER